MRELISARARAVQPSITLAISANAKAMRAAGRSVLDFSIGEPDFQTPDPIKEAAITAIRDGFTRYTAAGGIPELKAAIRKKYEEELNVTYEPGEILASNGGKHALHSVLQALLDPGDEVLIPAPYWLSYPDLVRLSGGKPVILNTRFDEGSKTTAGALGAAITSRTKALILNSPSNPAGVLYSAEELKALASVVDSSGIVLISDDVYEKYVYDGRPFVNVLAVAPQLRERVVVINSASKTFAMPGWRIGYALGPVSIIAAATRIQGQATSCAGSISQKALTFAFQTDPEIVEGFRRSFEARRDLMLDGLRNIPGIRVQRPAGAFYLFVDVSGLMERVNGVSDSVTFCEYLLEHCGIAAVPGKAFGDDRCIRLSFVASDEDIDECIRRLGTI